MFPAIVDALRGVNRDVEPMHGIRLAVRVGIHSGVSIVGDARGKPDVLGDLPNIASACRELPSQTRC